MGTQGSAGEAAPLPSLRCWKSGSWTIVMWFDNELQLQLPHFDSLGEHTRRVLLGHASFLEILHRRQHVLAAFAAEDVCLVLPTRWRYDSMLAELSAY